MDRDNQTQAPGEGVHRHPRQQQTREDPDVRITQRYNHAEGNAQTHKQKTPRNTGTRTRRPTQPQARTPRGTHTHSGWGRVWHSRGGESEPRELAAPPRSPATRTQPSSAREDFPSSSLNKGPPAVGVHGSLCARPQGLCAAATAAGEAPALARVRERRCGPCAGGCGAYPLPTGSPRPGRPGAQHRASPSPLLPSRPIERQTFPRPLLERSSLAQPGPGKRHWGLLPAPTQLRGAAASSRSRAALGPALLSRGRRRYSRSFPSVTRETASSSLPPTNQHRSHGASQPMGDLAIPGSRALSQARGPKREAGVSLELLPLKGRPPGVGGGG